MLRTYTVQSGDTLSGIAHQQLGDASRWPEIFLLNRSIRHPDRISPGQVLTLPVDTPTQPPPRRYIVRRGDTLSGIAQRELGDASRSRSLRIRAPKAHMTGRSTWQLATSAERRVGQPPARSRWR
jgi:nucleoid-associated protein YgaU